MSRPSNLNTHEQGIFESHVLALHVRTDRIFAWLLIVEWVAGVVLALLSPRFGDATHLRANLYAAIFLGGVAAFGSSLLMLRRPGGLHNPIAAAVAQMLFSGLYIHFTGGRIETHFHVFGSLALLGFYRDLRPLAVATGLAVADHFIRGAFWPESIYGVAAASPLRALEHAGWLLFEALFLALGIRNGLAFLRLLARNQAETEAVLSNVERLVEQRTRALRQSQRVVTEQQQSLAASSRMSALGEMAGGVAHEINTPLAIIAMRSEQIEESFREKTVNESEMLECATTIQQTVKRISTIIDSLRTFSRDGQRIQMEPTPIQDLVRGTLNLCGERFRSRGVKLEDQTDKLTSSVRIECRRPDISQVLLNLLNNAFDAVENHPEKWIRVDAKEMDTEVELSVTDSGPGLSADAREKLMQPFFTTKEVGKGTGLGLSTAKGLVEAHGGKLFFDTASPRTRFVIRMPKLPPVSVAPKVTAPKVS